MNLILSIIVNKINYIKMQKKIDPNKLFEMFINKVINIIHNTRIMDEKGFLYGEFDKTVCNVM